MTKRITVTGHIDVELKLLEAIRESWAAAAHSPRIEFDESLPLVADDAIAKLQVEPGIDEEVAEVIIEFLPLMSRAAEQLWDAVVFPWVERVFGEGTVAETKESDEDAD